MNTVTENNKYKIRVIISMLIWSTVGIFVKEIKLASIEIAFYRSFIGCAFIIILNVFKKEKFILKDIKANIKVLAATGISLGLGWALLFQGYKYTTISNATLAYYIAPIIIIIMSAILFKEKINFKKTLCITIAMAGLILIVKSNDVTSVAYNHKLGVIYAVAGGFFYAFVVVLNKYIKNLSSSITTIIQLFAASLILQPFVFSNMGNILTLDLKSLILLFIVGVIHTGSTYTLYLSSVRYLEGQTIAILSYIDPIFAVILSTILLKENMTAVQMLGGAMILGAAFVSEYK